MRKLLISLGVLLVLLVIADRILVVVAQNQISDRLATAYDMPEKPAVSIHGFPFLTQALTGNYSEIDVTASQVSAGGIVLHDLNAKFTGVDAPLGQVLGRGVSKVTADRATGSAVITLGQIDQRLPPGIRIRPDGNHLTVSGTVRYQGARVPVSATVDLGISGTGIKVTPVHVTVSGGTGLPAAAAYASQLGIVIPLTALPLHLHLTSVSVAPGGVRIGASARHVHFARA
jgi:DUF2993 family protein